MSHLKDWMIGLLAGLALSVNVGCSSPYDGDDEDTAEYGYVEQAITGASSSGARSYGVSTGATRNSCNATSSGQACLVPLANKSYTYRISDGTGVSGHVWTSGQRGVIQATMQSVASATGWAITETLSTPTIEISGFGAIGGGPTSTAITAYRSWAPNGNQLVTLTDNVAGSWQGFGDSSCRIDMPDILTRAAGLPASAGAGAASELLAHAAANCALLATGVGTRANETAALSAADRSVHDTSANIVIDEQSKCLAKSRVNGIAGQFSFAGACNK